jgi:hypothetical protein
MLFTGSGLRPTFEEDLLKMWLFLPFSFLNVAMGFTEEEPAWDILLHCTSGLRRQNLIEEAHWGSPEHVNMLNKHKGWCEVSEYGLCVEPTQFGIDYWLWALGIGTVTRIRFLDADLMIPKLPDIHVPDGPIKLVKG